MTNEIKTVELKDGTIVQAMYPAAVKLQLKVLVDKSHSSMDWGCAVWDAVEYAKNNAHPVASRSKELIAMGDAAPWWPMHQDLQAVLRNHVELRGVLAEVWWIRRDGSEEQL